MRIQSTAALIAVAVLATTALAKETPPPAGEPVDFKLPTPRRLTLDNGMKVTLVEYGNVPKLDVRLVLRTGNVDEAPDQTWLSDLMIDLMEQGTARRSGEEVALAAARMGGSIAYGVAPDQTYIAGEALSEYGPDLVALIAEVVREPLLPADQLDRLKADLVRTIAIARARPQSLADERFARVIYGDHPYGRYFPEPALVQSFTLDQIKAFYAEHVGAARAHLYVAGQFDGAALEAAIREAFGGWEKGTEFAGPTPTLKRRPRKQVYVIDRPGAVQSTLRLGLPAVDPSHPDYIPLQVTNALLGGSFSSRITSNIREDKGYTYSPRSVVDVRYRAGLWVMNADVTTAQTGASIKEILFEIDRLRKAPPPAEELKAIQTYLTGSFILQNSFRGAVLAQLEFVDLHGLGDDYLTGYVDRVLAVKPADVTAMVKKYVDPKQLVFVVVGDEKVIKKQLARYGKLAR